MSPTDFPDEASHRRLCYVKNDGWRILFGVSVNPLPIFPDDNLDPPGFSCANYCFVWPCQHLCMFETRCVSVPGVFNVSFPVLQPEPHGNGVFGVCKVYPLLRSRSVNIRNDLLKLLFGHAKSLPPLDREDNTCAPCSSTGLSRRTAARRRDAVGPPGWWRTILSHLCACGVVSSACRQDPKRAVVGVTQTLILLGLDWFHIQRNN